ncbi:MAG: virB9 2 [Gammaproteobacteria bacterium]|jgi:type IV secretion system protein VirB9|nr:virB9 2 [Gammaproteobacteria bacterium]
MFKKSLSLVSVLYVLLMGLPPIWFQAALAEGLVQSFKTDPRAKVVAFEPNQIYAVKTHYLVSTDIILGEDEIVQPQDVHLGDASAWDIAVSRNHLYLKAKKLDAKGNLSVLSNRYAYHFILSATDEDQDRSESIFFLKFVYPNRGHDEKRLALEMVSLPPDLCQNAAHYNLQYSFTGNPEQAPLCACDDGLFTYFKFKKQSDLPAIFSVLPDRREEVVNYRMEGDYMVVERTAKVFTLRNGALVTSIYNDKYIGDWDRVKK